MTNPFTPLLKCWLLVLIQEKFEIFQLQRIVENCMKSWIAKNARIYSQSALFLIVMVLLIRMHMSQDNSLEEKLIRTLINTASVMQYYLHVYVSYVYFADFTLNYLTIHNRT